MILAEYANGLIRLGEALKNPASTVEEIVTLGRAVDLVIGFTVRTRVSDENAPLPEAST